MSFLFLHGLRGGGFVDWVRLAVPVFTAQHAVAAGQPGATVVVEASPTSVQHATTSGQVNASTSVSLTPTTIGHACAADSTAGGVLYALTAAGSNHSTTASQSGVFASVLEIDTSELQVALLHSSLIARSLSSVTTRAGSIILRHSSLPVIL